MSSPSNKLELNFKITDTEYDASLDEPEVNQVIKTLFVSYPDYKHLDAVLDTTYNLLQTMGFRKEVILKYVQEWIEEKEE